MHFILCLIFVVFSGVSRAQLADIRVIKSDMVNTMEDYAVGETLVLLAKENDFNVISQKLVNLMDQEYGTGWLALFVANSTSSIPGLNLTKNTTLILGYQQSNLFLAQQQKYQAHNNVTEVNWKTIIEQAQNATVETNWQGNNLTEFNIVLNMTKNIIKSNQKLHASCDFDQDKPFNTNWCYKLLTQNLENSLEPIWRNKMLSVTASSNNRGFTYVKNHTNSISFNLGPIFFQFDKYT